jgi:hypothetical protein
MVEIGVIFHFGLYSVPGFIHDMKKPGNGSEWYLKRLLEDGKFRPISGYKKTQEFHSENYGANSYRDFKKYINVEESTSGNNRKMVKNSCISWSNICDFNNKTS